MGEDHCVSYADIVGPALEEWTLLSSRPLPGVFRIPTSAERTHFERVVSDCVQQGDLPNTPCVRPTLLAITDLDKNGELEYWATDPYMWDTGLTVWKGKSALTRFLAVCVGCSD